MVKSRQVGTNPSIHSDQISTVEVSTKLASKRYSTATSPSLELAPGVHLAASLPEGMGGELHDAAQVDDLDAWWSTSRR